MELNLHLGSNRQHGGQMKKSSTPLQQYRSPEHEKQLGLVTPRRFPHPYRAGFAICSDIDLCTRSQFIRIHQQLNNTKTGFGLPVADSFFGCRVDREQIGYIDPVTQKPGADAPFIREGIHAGLFDCFHGWGDFNDRDPDPAFVNNIAAAVVKDFKKFELSVPVWINHGSIRNLQNLSCRLYPFFQGDNPSSPLYTARYLPRLGIRYVWTTEIVPWPLSGNQSRTYTSRFFRRRVTEFKNIVKRLRREGELQRGHTMQEEFCVRFPLKNRRHYWGFTRWNADPRGVWYRPGRNTLAAQLPPDAIRQLLDTEGYAALYVHLGLPVQNVAAEPLFSNESYRVLEALARRFHDGELWVTPTSRLVDYWVMWHTSRWDAVCTDAGGIDIIITNPDSNTVFSGLTFATPLPDKTRIIAQGSILPVSKIAAKGTELPCVTVGLPPPPSIDFL